MTVHIEWASAPDTHAVLVKPEDFEDEFGLEPDDPSLPTLLIGLDPAFAICGTLDELQDMLHRILHVVIAAKPTADSTIDAR